MARVEKLKLKTCRNGHTLYKRSDCEVGVVGEAERKPQSGFLSGLAAPARRALEREGITSPAGLSRNSEQEILQLHGMGPRAVTHLKKAHQEFGLSLRQE